MLTGSKLDRREMPAQLSPVSPCSKLKAIICRRLPGRHPANRWRRSLAGTKRWQIRTKNKERGQLSLRPKKKTGHAPSRAPFLHGFSRSEREADSQAELPLIELGAFDFHKAPAGKVAIGIVEMR